MKYANAREAVFLDRPNRFIAHVQVDEEILTVHVKNTGRCRELLIPGAKVILEKSDNPTRKTAYDLISVYKGGLGWVNIDSQLPNTVVREWLESKPTLFPELSLIRPEYSFGNSRVDFYLEYHEGDRIGKILMEVKGCTLERERIGYFPDAPTERGVKHLKELTEACEKGYECYLAFVIAMPEVTIVYPNTETDPQFAQALAAAESAGVKVLFLCCEVKEDSLKIVEAITKK